MSTLQEIVTQIKQKEKEAAIDVTSVPYSVRAGTEALVRNATSDLVNLKKEYKDSVIRSAMVISVSGPGAKEFAQLGRKHFKMLSYDIDELAQDLEAKILSRGAREEYRSHEHQLLLTELLHLKNALGIASLPNPVPDLAYGFPTSEGVRKVLSSNYGVSLSLAFIRRKIEEEAFAAMFAGKTLGVIVSNIGDGDITILPTSSFKIELSGQSVTKKLVGEELSSIKASLQKKVTVTQENQEQEQTVKENE